MKSRDHCNNDVAAEGRLKYHLSTNAPPAADPQAIPGGHPAQKARGQIHFTTHKANPRRPMFSHWNVRPQDVPSRRLVARLGLSLPGAGADVVHEGERGAVQDKQQVRRQSEERSDRGLCFAIV